LSEGDVQMPKLFRQTVPQRWPGSGESAVGILWCRWCFQSAF